ncbi:WXG100 family type VII secretion target, partial [Enterococcus hirae]|uniref:WXG100 family type VII secretion target n=1 Tax=Enterococcus hirae TaxID=1354 RepID=UPI00136A169C
MADQIRVNFSSLDAAVTDIAGGVAAQGARMDDLRSAIAPLVASWDGAAQEAYGRQQDTWNQAWSELTDALSGLQRATDTANQGY